MNEQFAIQCHVTFCDNEGAVIWHGSLLAGSRPNFELDGWILANAISLQSRPIVHIEYCQFIHSAPMLRAIKTGEMYLGHDAWDVYYCAGDSLWLEAPVSRVYGSPLDVALTLHGMDGLIDYVVETVHSATGDHARCEFCGGAS